ncbi:DNA alkylation repair protein [Gorillibacterium sp. sgz5001074]|uniref:DNA alkylation repair protein n=1 Tax=Gorillibacterium sp. sgz5001074 TaxID=3446695 RepID=UPI003F665BAE
MEPLKQMYTRELLEGFAAEVKAVYPPFESGRFLELVFDREWSNRELKDRYRHISATLRQTLPPDYREALGILEQLADTGRFKGFPYIFFPDFVQTFGLEDWEASVPALRRFTSLNSSEFAVRPYIEQDPERMLGILLEWASDPDEHVRRLASEGCRPRLPWAPPLRRLIADPAPVLPILERLKADSSEYVRRSVANNLNDISKDHPELVLGLAADWIGRDPCTDRILKHACRTLLKKGHPEALRLFGFADEDGPGAEAVAVKELELTPQVLRIGEELIFCFRISAPEAASFRLQFAVDYRKANGGTSAKRFHIGEKRGFQGEEQITRRLSFKDLSTRKHYPGEHRLTILVNGIAAASEMFTLLDT